MPLDSGSEAGATEEHNTEPQFISYFAVDAFACVW